MVLLGASRTTYGQPDAGGGGQLSRIGLLMLQEGPVFVSQGALEKSINL